MAGIISTTEYNVYAGIADTSFNTRLAVFIDLTQANLERATGRLFDEKDYIDEKHDGNDQSSIWLDNTPVTVVESVKLLATDGSTETLDASTYRFTETGELHRLSGLNHHSEHHDNIGFGLNRHRGAVWPEDVENVLVSYTGGYDSNKMPNDLKGLMYMLVDSVFDQVRENWMLGSTNDGVEAKTFLSPTDISTRFASLIAPWRRQVGV